MQIHHFLRNGNRPWQLMVASAAVVFTFCTCSFFLFAQPTPAQQDEVFGNASQEEKTVSIAVAQLMNQHLSKRTLNDEISERALSMYVKGLDPLKVYFNQSDIDEFQTWSHDIDDMMPQGNYTAAFNIFSRFLDRIDERVGWAQELLDDPQDYSTDESILVDRDLMTFATDSDDAQERWRKRIKYDMLVFVNGEQRREDKAREVAAKEGKEFDLATFKPKDPVADLKRRYQSFRKQMHQFDNEDVVEKYVSAITHSFDPHTEYMSRSTFESFQINMRLELEGIGATLQTSDDGLTIIRRVVPGGAAAKQGELEVEDKIAAVGQGAGGEMLDIVDMKLDNVVSKIRGKAGTIVRLMVVKPSGERKEIKIARERIELKDSEAHGEIFEVGEKSSGNALKIGVIDLPSFYLDMEGKRAGRPGFKSTTRDVRRILEDFTQQGVDGVVLDLRMNGGGSLDEAVACTGLFVDHGPIVQIKDLSGRIDVLNDEAFGMAWDGPLVVVTSKLSASASEILAGAVQDYGRGLIVGDSATHGKGTVQTLLNLAEMLYRTRETEPTLGALKITISQFYRPNGDSTQKRGVLADVVLPSITDHMDIAESDLDHPIDFDRVPKAKYGELNLVSPDTVTRLQSHSQQRIAESSEFSKFLARIETYKSQKEEKSISLNETVFMELRKELDADDEEVQLAEKQSNSDSGKIERDFYLNEVLSITSEYIELLSGRPLAVR